MKKLTFYQVTDTHTILPEDFEDEASKQEARQRLLVLDTVYNQIIDDKDTDTVIISGDVANNGRYNQHKTFIEHTRRLLDAGKKVYLITATHDFGLTKVFPDGKSEAREGVANRCELRDMYEDFGFSSSIAEFDRNSYVAKPCDGFRILCLNDDGDGTKFRGYSEEQKKWILEQIKAARDCGDYIFAVTHHPVIPPTPIYPALDRNSMIGDYENTEKFFADNGIKFVFTGHTHMQSIRSITTENGNVLYDINTGTISEFPLVFRKVTVYDNGEADVRTMPVGAVPFSTDGKEVRQYYSDKFDRRILGGIDGMINDFDLFAREIGQLAINVSSLRPFKKPLSLVGKFLDRVTVGEICKLILCPKQADREIKDSRFKFLLAALLRNVYSGDEPFSPDTHEYKVIMAIVSRIELLLKKKLAGTQQENLKEFVESIIYDPTPDSDAYLK